MGVGAPAAAAAAIPFSGCVIVGIDAVEAAEDHQGITEEEEALEGATREEGAEGL